jgi:hypothetical protein
MEELMRLRLTPKLRPSIERLARLESRSLSKMTEVLVAVGLRSLGVATSAPEETPDHLDCRMSLPLTGVERTEIKRLARAENRSNRGMAHELILAGLRDRGAWPPPDADRATGAGA